MGICDKVGFERRIPIPFAYSQKVFSFRVGMLTISSRKRFFVFMNCVCAVLLHFLHKNLPIFAQKEAWRKPSKNSCTNSPRFYLLGKLCSYYYVASKACENTQGIHSPAVYYYNCAEASPPLNDEPSSYYSPFSVGCKNVKQHEGGMNIWVCGLLD